MKMSKSRDLFLRSTTLHFYFKISYKYLFFLIYYVPSLWKLKILFWGRTRSIQSNINQCTTGIAWLIMICIMVMKANISTWIINKNKLFFLNIFRRTYKWVSDERQNDVKLSVLLIKFLKKIFLLLWRTYKWLELFSLKTTSKKNLHRNSKAEPSVICQYVCQSFLFVQPIRS